MSWKNEHSKNFTSHQLMLKMIPMNLSKHLTHSFSVAGCLALKKSDFSIFLKLFWGCVLENYFVFDRVIWSRSRCAGAKQPVPRSTSVAKSVPTWYFIEICSSVSEICVWQHGLALRCRIFELSHFFSGWAKK